jgi:hypothetical protein
MASRHRAPHRRIGHDVIRFVHMTDQERFGYRTGGYADECYLAAGWGEPNRRYWLDGAEMTRRLSILGDRYTTAGFARDGSSHGIDFTAEAVHRALAG